MGKLVGNFAELFKYGCIQTGADDPTIKFKDAEKRYTSIFMILMGATNCDPCTDCPVKKQKCRAWHEFHEDARDARVREEIRRKKATQATRPPGTDKYPGLSVAQIATKLNVSKSEVRRLKAAGEL